MMQIQLLPLWGITKRKWSDSSFVSIMQTEQMNELCNCYKSTVRSFGVICVKVLARNHADFCCISKHWYVFKIVWLLHHKYKC